MITRKDVITSSGFYPERANSPELTPEVLANIDALLIRVNALLADPQLASALKTIGTVRLSSGFRPTDVNYKIANAAKKSTHSVGMGIDIIDDKDQTLAKAVTKELLVKYDLYREDSDHTIGKVSNWCHLQSRKTLSGNRIFQP